MSEKLVLHPGPEHPISVTASAERVTVTARGVMIADTRSALVLREQGYPIAYYIPRADVEMAQLRQTEHETYCPYKGEAHYFTVLSADGELTNVVWTYEDPHKAVAEIRDHLAFYPDRVEVTAGPQ
ncbi:DUF427 domain-containing protein [Nesterenkonia lutea]|uniref:Uncharacterized protein (DUF427 family) n=1 Tax=Nesterenkonia lutea TaxID=272919 RepID=A0ABR9JGJ7_9MICC|nr:DUF427 domain-containing protein [Nesterenkonia lutea]MBE1525066.1 uncharacterized protein (DUF427 family) [Nesterenkonia lutea]